MAGFFWFKEVKRFDDISGEGHDRILSKEESIMLERVERIERVARVTGITNDNKHRFDSGRHRRDESGTFAEELRRAMNKKPAPVNKSEIPEAYNLELTSCGTHSLFYVGGLGLERLLA